MEPGLKLSVQGPITEAPPLDLPDLEKLFIVYVAKKTHKELPQES